MEPICDNSLLVEGYGRVVLTALLCCEDYCNVRSYLTYACMCDAKLRWCWIVSWQVGDTAAFCYGVAKSGVLVDRKE